MPVWLIVLLVPVGLFLAVMLRGWVAATRDYENIAAHAHRDARRQIDRETGAARPSDRIAPAIVSSGQRGEEPLDHPLARLLAADEGWFEHEKIAESKRGLHEAAALHGEATDRAAAEMLEEMCAHTRTMPFASRGSRPATWPRRRKSAFVCGRHRHAP